MNRAKAYLSTLFVLLAFINSYNLSAQEVDAPLNFSVKGDFIGDDEAVIQLDSGYIYYSNELELYFNHTIRIQILKESGKKWGNFSLPYAKEDSLIKIEGKVYCLAGDKVQEATVKQSAFKVKEIEDNQLEASYNTNEVKVGDIVEFTYQLKFGDWKNIHNWYFQNDIPVLRSTFTTKIPSFIFFYKFLEGVRNLTDIERSITTDSIKGEPYNMQLETFEMDSIAAYKYEQDIPGDEFFISKLSYHLAEYTLPDFTTVYLLPQAYEELAFNWASDPYFNQIQLKAEYLNEKVDQIYHRSFTDEKNIQSFYFFVRNNFEVDNNLYDKNLQQTYNRRRGNEQQINMILAKMLNQAGYDAYLVALSTIDNRPVYPDFPYFELFNKYVVFVRTMDQNYFLDASDKNLLFNMLAPNCINNGGLIISKSSNGLYPLNFLFDDREEIEGNFSITDSATVAGKYRVKRDGYSVYTFDTQYLTDFRSYNDYLIETIFENPKWNIISHDVKDEFNDNKVIQEELVFARPFDKTDGTTIRINPLIKNEFTSNPFPDVDRQNPITLYAPLYRKGSFTYKIPEGYSIQSLPQSNAVSMESFNCDFRYQVSRSGNTITLSYVIDVNKVIFMANEYKALSSFFDQVTKSLNQMIVLTKN